MHIKIAGNRRPSIYFIGRGTLAMPTETAVFIAAIIAAFVIYAAALAWADYYSHHRPNS
jgi:hypothetical protein